jgi:hypothetical protein
MSDKKEAVSKRSTIEYDLDTWRARFHELKKDLPKNWMGKLALFDREFDSHDGTLTMMAVQRNRAGLVKTIQVVTTVEAMLKNKSKDSSLYKKWKSGNLKKASA